MVSSTGMGRAQVFREVRPMQTDGENADIVETELTVVAKVKFDEGSLDGARRLHLGGK